MNNRIEKFEDLTIWQEGVSLAVEVYRILKICKDYGLRDQIQRSAVSIPSNVAEGFDRQSNNEFLRFLRIAKGSCAELRTQLIIAERVGVVQEDENPMNKTKILSAKIQKMITYREKRR
ncbi:four helix bundle protein [Marinilabilia sp.]|uniref:four helix bundle protein n=1 Tax=Marinilabilia sp. TaxID=2021252 RepID=UPI0025BC7F9D|nr:four helix bundle protein [Marinilabilia sp.]